jgi:PIN domain nuclease of toxin-antitoxin system
MPARHAHRLELEAPARQWVAQATDDLKLRTLQISLEHAEQYTLLPFHHRDPFDRMLIAQAISESIPIVSADDWFDQYGITRIWK